MSEEQQVRLNVHTEKMGTSYANAFQVRYSQDAVLVSFGVSLTDLSAEPGVKGVVTADMGIVFFGSLASNGRIQGSSFSGLRLLSLGRIAGEKCSNLCQQESICM